MESSFSGYHNPAIFAREDAKDLRRQLFLKLGNVFKSLWEANIDNPKIDLIENFDVILNDFYWELLHERVAPYVIDSAKNRVSRFKMVSAMEISIMIILPFRLEDEKQIKKVNANFAFTVSKQILIFWSTYKASPEIRSFNTEHLCYLEHLDVNNVLPIFSNAQTFRLFDSLIKIKNDAFHSPIHDCAERMKEIRKIFELPQEELE